MVNKVINEKHITLVCHVHDLKVSYVDIFEINKFAGFLPSIYGGLTVHRGKLHDYLGMDL